MHRSISEQNVEVLLNFSTSSKPSMKSFNLLAKTAHELTYC